MKSHYHTSLATLLLATFCLKPLSSCGQPHQSMPLIVGGEPLAQEHEARANSVAISYRWQQICSGVFLADKRVITAAHCLARVRNLAQLRVHFSDTVDRDHPDDTRNVVEFKTHAEFQYPSNDIAWLELESDAPAYALPPLILKSDDLESGDQLILVGYGVTDEDRNLATRGKRLSTTTLFREKVPENRGYYGLFTYGPSPGKSACFGDSGGPVYAYHHSQLHLVGIATGSDFIIAETAGCNEGNGLVTAIQSHKEWLQTQGLL